MSKPLTMTVEQEREYRACCTSGGTEVDPVFAELDATRAALAAAEAKLAQWEEREAACCPEDFGFPEVIESLRAKLAEARAGQAADYAREIDRLEAKLAQAERERNDARNANLSVRVCRNHTSEVIGEGCLVCDLAASQARERELRDRLGSIARNTCCDRCQEAALVAREALARPADYSALREMLTKADSEGFLAGMKAQQYVTGGYGVFESDLVPDHVRVSRLLGGGK